MVLSPQRERTDGIDGQPYRDRMCCRLCNRDDPVHSVRPLRGSARRSNPPHRRAKKVVCGQGKPRPIHASRWWIAPHPEGASRAWGASIQSGETGPAAIWPNEPKRRLPVRFWQSEPNLVSSLGQQGEEHRFRAGARTRIVVIRLIVRTTSIRRLEAADDFLAVEQKRQRKSEPRSRPVGSISSTSMAAVQA